MIWTTLQDLLPQAAVLALSPVPIMAVIAMLIAPGGRAKATLFALGGFLGMVVAGVLLANAGGVAEPKGEPTTLSSAIRLGIGILLLVLAAKQWQSRPRPGDTPETPRFLTVLGNASPLMAFGLGVVMMAVKPKNLAILVAAGISFAEAGLTGNGLIPGVVIFSLFAASTLLLPVLFALILGEKADAALTSIGDWLAWNNAAIMFVLFLIIGLMLLGKGLGGLLG
jgi:hypothetical protein